MMFALFSLIQKQRHKYGWLCLTLILLTVSGVQAQVGAGGIPFSFQRNLPDAVPTVQMPQVDVAIYLAEDANVSKDEPFRFGAPIEVHYTLENSGQWTTLPDGSRIWRLRISSPGAYSINLLYDAFYLPEGAELFLYNDRQTQVIGAFTSANNWIDGTGATQPLAGDATTLEYFEPASVAGHGRISISRVVHAYRNVFGYRNHLDDYGDSGTCNNNVNCPEGLPWQNEKRSVALIIDQGFRLCTGSLINNTSNNFTPYFLTANHCIESSDETHWVFVFNYESPGCDNQNVPTNQTVSNAILRSTNAASDFALLQLSTNIPEAYHPYFNGWSRIDTPSTNSCAIHHPEGDIKKISFDNNPTTSDRYLGSSGVAGSHWKITTWDDGTTEGGSSGSPLFDQNHRIIGQLHGGYAACGNTLSDWYGKFAMSWAYGTSASTRLRDWLDPANTGVWTLDGIDPTVAGRIGGVVVDPYGDPLSGVRVHVIDSTQETTTNALGEYMLALPSGTFHLEFTKFGYQHMVQNNVTVVQNDTVWVNVVMAAVPAGILAGTVTTQDGTPLQNASVFISGTPYDTMQTDEYGHFFVELPATSYSVHVLFSAATNPPLNVRTDTTLTVLPGDTTHATVILYISLIEPAGPDAYGYRAYDRYDRDLPAPYDWIELDPSFGAPGMPFSFTASDSSAILTAPFPLTFYGGSSDTLTVNANGWLLPGIHRETGSVNSPIPYNAGNDPAGIIAPFWDRMQVGLGNQQFTWYDSRFHRWILEFTAQRVLNPTNRLQNWQVHFLDPVFYPTRTGDCEILFIYSRMDHLTDCTIGIENPNEQSGLQLLYNSALNTTCWPIEDGAAIRFTTGRSSESGGVTVSLTLYPAAPDLSGATIFMAGCAITANAENAFVHESVPAVSAAAMLFFAGYEAARISGIPVQPNVMNQAAMEAWRLDPPSQLYASQYDGIVTLSWRKPESILAAPNPDARYAVYRNGTRIAQSLADTVFTDEVQPNGQEATYRVVTQYRYGVSAPSDSVHLVIDLAADENISALPAVYALHPAYPNPFNPSATLAYDLPRAGRVSINLYNVNGQRVATLVDNVQAAGFYHVMWNAAGQPSGMYLAVFESGGHRFVQKMLLLK
ncbi:T9SS C-terminal target domain-containing protein [candidate division KSB1 bacterium]|nr:MAG: T9SS C-terminal target domain-containing protein [candidate division KSB1 bacterium]